MNINVDKLELIFEGLRGWLFRGFFIYIFKYGDGDMFLEYNEIAKSVFSFLFILLVLYSVF